MLLQGPGQPYATRIVSAFQFHSAREKYFLSVGRIVHRSPVLVYSVHLDLIDRKVSAGDARQINAIGDRKVLQRPLSRPNTHLVATESIQIRVINRAENI
jgi:hypothetical protein